MRREAGEVALKYQLQYRMSIDLGLRSSRKMLLEPSGVADFLANAGYLPQLLLPC